jgi:hypothetical protein
MGHEAARSFDCSPAPRSSSRIASARAIEKSRVGWLNAFTFPGIM